jgi:hypothetical protein
LMDIHEAPPVGLLEPRWMRGWGLPRWDEAKGRLAFYTAEKSLCESQGTRGQARRRPWEASEWR